MYWAITCLVIAVLFFALMAYLNARDDRKARAGTSVATTPSGGASTTPAPEKAKDGSKDKDKDKKKRHRIAVGFWIFVLALFGFTLWYFWSPISGAFMGGYNDIHGKVVAEAWAERERQSLERPTSFDSKGQQRVGYIVPFDTAGNLKSHFDNGTVSVRVNSAIVVQIHQWDGAGKSLFYPGDLGAVPGSFVLEGNATWGSYTQGGLTNGASLWRPIEPHSTNILSSFDWPHAINEGLRTASAIAHRRDGTAVLTGALLYSSTATPNGVSPSNSIVYLLYEHKRP